MRRATVLIALSLTAGVVFPSFAQSTPPGGQIFGEFMLTCKMNKMTDKKECIFESTPIADKSTPLQGFSLVFRSKDLITINVKDSILSAEARVDKNKALSFNCQEHIMCTLSDKWARLFAHQLESGKSVLFEVTTIDGQNEKQMNLEGYQKALAAYKEEMAGKHEP
jgi:hypothetical protein